MSVGAGLIQKPFATGTITIKPVARNAVRIQYSEGSAENTLPEWVYVRGEEVTDCKLKVGIDKKHNTLSIKDARGKIVFTATRHQLKDGQATLAFSSPKDECLFGLGQFQDGYSNVRGLSRRLTQVNTQISLPMLISSKGYGVLWNNYGMTEFNPSDQSVKLTRGNGDGVREEVDVTSTEGGKREVREHNFFEATLDVAEAGDYSLLLDVGQKMGTCAAASFHGGEAFLWRRGRGCAQGRQHPKSASAPHPAGRRCRRRTAHSRSGRSARPGP